MLLFSKTDERGQAVDSKSTIKQAENTLIQVLINS